MELGNIHDDDDGYVNALLGNGNDKELDLSNSLRQSLVNTYRCTRSRTSVLLGRLGVDVYVYVYVLRQS